MVFRSAKHSMYGSLVTRQSTCVGKAFESFAALLIAFVRSVVSVHVLPAKASVENISKARVYLLELARSLEF